MASVRIRLSSGVLKLLLALALVVGVGLMAVTPALAQISGQYAPSTDRFVADIDRLDIDEDDDIIVVDEDEGSAAPTSSGRAPVVGTTSPGGSPEASPTSSGRVPVVGTTSPGGSPEASPTSSGRAPLTASSPEAGKAEASGKAKAGRSSVKGVLPATGGPLLPIILLAGLALAGTGMLVLRRFSGRE